MNIDSPGRVRDVNLGFLGSLTNVKNYFLGRFNKMNDININIDSLDRS